MFASLRYFQSVTFCLGACASLILWLPSIWRLLLQLRTCFMGRNAVMVENMLFNCSRSIFPLSVFCSGKSIQWPLKYKKPKNGCVPTVTGFFSLAPQTDLVTLQERHHYCDFRPFLSSGIQKYILVVLEQEDGATPRFNSAQRWKPWNCGMTQKHLQLHLQTSWTFPASPPGFFWGSKTLTHFSNNCTHSSLSERLEVCFICGHPDLD